MITTGRPAAHVAAEIGVGEQVLGRWVRLARAADDGGNTSAVLDAWAPFACARSLGGLFC